MKQLIKQDSTLAKTNSTLTNLLSNRKSFSGEQILENLITISDVTDKQFTPTMLESFWQPFNNNYSKLRYYGLLNKSKLKRP